MNHSFEHEGEVFEVRKAILDDRCVVKVFLDEKQVSPEYSASFEMGQDYFSKHSTHIVEELARIAKKDICNGIYPKAE